MSVKDNELLEKEELSLEEPPKYNVIMLNDNKTTFEFVIYILMVYFEKTQEQAFVIANLIHEKGSSIVGTYSDEGAKTRVHHVHAEAKKHNLPLTCEIEEER